MEDEATSQKTPEGMNGSEGGVSSPEPKKSSPSPPEADVSVADEVRQLESEVKKANQHPSEEAEEEKAELADVPLNGSEDESTGGGEVAVSAKEEVTDVTIEEREEERRDCVSLSPVSGVSIEDERLSPTTRQAKYDLLSKAGVTLEGGGGGGEENIEKYSEALMESGEGEEEEEGVTVAVSNGEKERGSLKHVRFADEVMKMGRNSSASSEEQEATQPENSRQHEQLRQEEEVREEEEE